MDPTRLRYLLAVAEHGGFSRAAAALGLAQPSLSRQVALLESEAGRPLLYRHGRGASLTEDGRRLAEAARPLLAALEALPGAMTEAMPAGQVVLGVPSFMAVHLAEPIFGPLRQRHPQLRVRLVDGFSGFMNQWLLEGRVDLAILYDARRSRAVAAEILAEETLFLFARARRAARELPGKGAVPPEALARLPMILPDRQHGLRRALDRAGARADPARLLEVDSLTAIRALVEADMGWSVLPQAGLRREAADRRFILRPIGAPPLHVRLMLAVSPAQPMTPALRAVMSWLRDTVTQLQCQGVMTPRPALR
jgi:LysR family transcriptional regulator, nitrogen assimilation regulatory protein